MYEIQWKFCRVYKSSVYVGELYEKLDKDWSFFDSAETISQARKIREEAQKRYRNFGKPAEVYFVFRVYNPKTNKEIMAESSYDRMLSKFWNLENIYRGAFYGFVRDQNKTHAEILDYLNNYVYGSRDFGELPGKYQELLMKYVDGLWAMVDLFVEFGYKFPDIEFIKAKDLKDEYLRTAGEMPCGSVWKDSRKVYSEFGR